MAAARTKSRKRPKLSPSPRDPAQPSSSTGRLRGILAALILATVALTAAVVFSVSMFDESAASRRQRERRVATRQPLLPSDTSSSAEVADADQLTRYFTRDNLTMVWDTIKPDVLKLVKPTSTTISNIAPSDYVGPKGCAECHRENYDNWANHPHRWMNAVADNQSVRGDFSGKQPMAYRGGIARFYRENGKYMMRFDRPDLHRVYEIRQTIGSRFYQYYVGIGIAGPEPEEHDYYRKDHVLPFGYWLERKAWVPIVHVHDETSEDLRWDPVETSKPAVSTLHREDVGRARGVMDPSVDLALQYSIVCNYCHTTFPIADMFVRSPERMGPSLTSRSLFALSQYVAENRPEIWDGSQPPEAFSSAAIEQMTGTFIAFDAREEAATLGVSCEACHLGCAAHVNQPTTKPPFVPMNPHLLSFADPSAMDSGRTAVNINAACGRCHSGNRPTYASGISTWNSTEHTDAMRGSCYSQLTCTDCHDPHKATGLSWPKTAAEDDASCLKCHEHLRQQDARYAHTHHLGGSTGDRCMNCHMPHINEGMQDVVRTHTIFSPTNADMIESNQPNACNLCHVEKSIDWTLQYLLLWYGQRYAESQIAQNYPSRKASVALGWLQSPHEATRLVAADALRRQDAMWALDSLVSMLDDPFLMNRQFTQTSLEKMLNVRLDEVFGYWYYASPTERSAPIERIREYVQSQSQK